MRSANVSTFSGKTVDILNPHPSQFEITDIARGLSNLCRYNGQTSLFYSVAQHSVLLSVIVPENVASRGPTSPWEYNNIAKAALMHDAVEAYTGDIVTPLKNALVGYRENIEDPLIEAIFERFNIPTGLLECVQEWDKRICVNEMDRLFYGGVKAELAYLPPIPNLNIVPMPPEEAERYFLQRFKQLFSGSDKARFNG